MGHRDPPADLVLLTGPTGSDPGRNQNPNPSGLNPAFPIGAYLIWIKIGGSPDPVHCFHANHMSPFHLRRSANSTWEQRPTYNSHSASRFYFYPGKMNRYRHCRTRDNGVHRIGFSSKFRPHSPNPGRFFSSMGLEAIKRAVTIIPACRSSLLSDNNMHNTMK